MTHTELLEREADNYFQRMFMTSKAPSIEYYNSEISGKLYSINREQDQLVFLNKLKGMIKEKWDEHRLVCKDPEKCIHEEEYGFSILVIDQFMESIADSYEYQPNEREDRFSADDITNLNLKIDQILKKLEDHDLHHEIIFNEVDDLRYHFNLGKKNWWSLLKGKIVDWAGAGVSAIAIQTIIEETELLENISIALQSISSIK